MQEPKKRSRVSKVKNLIMKQEGRRQNDVLPAQDKVDIMEFLLQCPADKMLSYNNNKYPTFIVGCALLLINNKMDVYFSVLESCKRMAKNDSLSAVYDNLGANNEKKSE